jgi:hypothetical protein
VIALLTGCYTGVFDHNGDAVAKDMGDGVLSISVIAKRTAICSNAATQNSDR